MNFEKITQQQNFVTTDEPVPVQKDGKKPKMVVGIREEEKGYEGTLHINNASFNPDALPIGSKIELKPPTKDTKFAPSTAPSREGGRMVFSYGSYLTINGENGEGFIDQNPRQSGNAGGQSGGVGASPPFSPAPSTAPQPLERYRNAMKEAITHYQIDLIDVTKVNFGEVGSVDPYVIGAVVEKSVALAISENIGKTRGEIENKDQPADDGLGDIPF